MRFISLDLELNQPSNRIIQIGAASFDTDVGMLDSISLYVEPDEEVNWGHKLNIGCRLDELLPISFRPNWERERYEHKEAMELFWKWHKEQQCGKKMIQWGRGDLKLLIGESQGCGYPSHLRILDLKQVYRYLWQPSAHLEAQSGLSSACKSLDVRCPAPAHNALEDAISTGEVFMKMFKQLRGLNKLLKEL